jgi:hypothetical protein
MERVVFAHEVRCDLDHERTHDRCVCANWTARTSPRSWSAVAWPGTARGSAAAAIAVEMQAAAEGATITTSYPLPG